MWFHHSTVCTVLCPTIFLKTYWTLYVHTYTCAYSCNTSSTPGPIHKTFLQVVSTIFSTSKFLHDPLVPVRYNVFQSACSGTSYAFLLYIFDTSLIAIHSINHRTSWRTCIKNSSVICVRYFRFSFFFLHQYVAKQISKSKRSTLSKSIKNKDS